MADVCVGTSVAAIRNSFVEVQRTKIKVALVVFDDDFSNKFIKIGADVTAVDLPNVTLIDNLNKIPSDSQGFQLSAIDSTFLLVWYCHP